MSAPLIPSHFREAKGRQFPASRKDTRSFPCRSSKLLIGDIHDRSFNCLAIATSARDVVDLTVP
jgi:hypothetical protein